MSGPAPATPLHGLRVLVVEDEMLVAMLVEDLLAELGCQLAGVAGRVDKALRMATDERLDFAILDVNLAGEKVYPVAEALAARGIPFVLATGYGSEGVDPAFHGAPSLRKPFKGDDLARAIEDGLRSGARRRDPA